MTSKTRGLQDISGRRRSAWIGLFVGSMLLGACAGRGAPDPFEGGREAEEITVEVYNGNYLDVVVFGMQDGMALRLGSVTGLASSTLSVPSQLVVIGQIRLLVDPVGSPEAYLSDPIMVNPGDVVVLRVASRVQQSSWSVRSGP